MANRREKAGKSAEAMTTSDMRKLESKNAAYDPDYLYMRNVGKAGIQDQQKRMRQKAEAQGGYDDPKRIPPAPSRSDWKVADKPAAKPKAKPKPKPKKTTSSASGGSSSRSGVGSSKGATVAKSSKPAPPETESTAPKEAPLIGGKYQSPNRTLANLPTQKVKGRSRLRRVASAVGRAFRGKGKPARAVAKNQDKVFEKKTRYA